MNPVDTAIYVLELEGVCRLARLHEPMGFLGFIIIRSEDIWRPHQFIFFLIRSNLVRINHKMVFSAQGQDLGHDREVLVERIATQDPLVNPD